MYVPGSKVLILQGEVSEYDVKGQIVTQRIGAGKYQAQAGEARPLNGPDGYDLKASYFQLAGLTAGGVVGDKGVSLASAVRCLTGLTGKAQQEVAAYCQATHFHPPQSVELVVALGQVAAQAVGLEGKIEQWRGHVL
jgi:uracil-DNA glycosylase